MCVSAVLLGNWLYINFLRIVQSFNCFHFCTKEHDWISVTTPASVYPLRQILRLERDTSKTIKIPKRESNIAVGQWQNLLTELLWINLISQFSFLVLWLMFCFGFFKIEINLFSCGYYGKESNRKLIVNLIYKLWILQTHSPVRISRITHMQAKAFSFMLMIQTQPLCLIIHLLR